MSRRSPHARPTIGGVTITRMNTGYVDLSTMPGKKPRRKARAYGAKVAARKHSRRHKGQQS